MCFVEVDIDAIIEEKCKDPEFKREYEKVKERYNVKEMKNLFEYSDKSNNKINSNSLNDIYKLKINNGKEKEAVAEEQ